MYCEEVFETRRRKTREVKVGSVGIGGDNPVRIQSMTTSNTRDVEATVEQILRLEKAGCEIVRVTVQGMKEAEACAEIKALLAKKGSTIPLVADIHFYPPAAMKVIESVDKVRINPGNFVDKRASFIKKEYDDASYLEESKKIEEKFSPLVLKAKQLKKSMRIGTNHGSLSDRIMNRYGDTPKGMVESALEFARICRQHDYHDFIFSMKASNPLIMIEAYRLLSAEMFSLGWDYPLHLGVTEAGEGEDGRIKSSLGIGSLLLDGIGDTIRVSLTEDPWSEIDPCRRLVNFASSYLGKKIKPFKETFRNKEVSKPLQILNESFLHPKAAVILPVTKEEISSLDLEIKGGKKGLYTPDFLWLKDESLEGLDLEALAKAKVGILSEKIDHPLVTKLKTIKDEDLSFSALLLEEVTEEALDKITLSSPSFILYRPASGFFLHEGRRLFEELSVRGVNSPVILCFSRDLPFEEVVIQFSAECGSLLIDGLFNGVCLDVKGSFSEKKSLAFSLLQAARRKTVKTEFISCPGCGRTLFDLQEISRRIRSKTAHLPGVRIAIMGCIVNGPGEMADADFGYVGSRPGKIDLYVGKECVEKNIEFDEADSRLIDLIKKHGKWEDSIN